MEVRTRIAPSPTGIAHIGNMYTALINYAFTKNNNGKFILRIEDTDRERFVPGSESIIIKSLHWLGIDYDEGPIIKGPFEPYIQSKRLSIYEKYAQELVNKNKAYHCFCTQERLAAMRKAQQKAGKPPMYDGRCRKIAKTEVNIRIKKEKFTIRLKVPKSGTTSWLDLVRGKISFANQTIDDQVLLKSDGYPTYHLAVVVDDHLMRISHVIRAEEWISSTPKHILLYLAFKWEKPEFAHTPLLRNADRSKLSKRRNPVSVMWYQERGFLPEALVNFLCLMGWSHPQEKEIFSFKEFISKFSLERIQTSQPIFDLEKLRWMNGIYIRNKKDEELLHLLKPFIPKAAKPEIIRKILPLVRKRIHTLEEFSDFTEFFFIKPEVDTNLLLKQSKHNRKKTKDKLNQYIKSINQVSSKDFTSDHLEKISRAFLDNDWNAKKLFMTVRVAITGKMVSPPLFESIEILGKKETIQRLNTASITL